MRAGSLDRVIEIQRRSTVIDSYGSATDVWSKTATMRAQLLQFATDDRETAGGNRSDTTVTFRMRFIDGVDLEQRVSYQGKAYTIRQIKELGRRVGLDLVCERVGP